VLLGRIRAVHARSRGTYGAPRVHAQLRRDGVCTSRKRVERLMRAHGLQGAFLRKRWRCSTRQDPSATPAPDLVRRCFTAPAPNRLWVADISRIPTGQGPLWLASVRDAFSNRVVGWKAADRADTELVLGALEYGLWGRHDAGAGRAKPDPAQPRLIHHSDPLNPSSTPPSGSPNASTTPACAPRWARSATAMTLSPGSVVRGVALWSDPSFEWPCGTAQAVCGMMVADAVSGSDPSFEWPFVVPTR